MESAASIVDKIKGVAKSGQDFVDSLLLRRKKSSRRNPFKEMGGGIRPSDTSKIAEQLAEKKKGFGYLMNLIKPGSEEKDHWSLSKLFQSVYHAGWILGLLFVGITAETVVTFSVTSAPKEELLLLLMRMLSQLEFVTDAWRK